MSARQELHWVDQDRNVPAVTTQPDRVWLIPGLTDMPALPIVAIHGRSAFLMDIGHDWSMRGPGGCLRYSPGGGIIGALLLCEWDDKAERKAQRIGTHATHCCKRHGCKYGDEDCPVVLGAAQQEYACEDDRRGSRCLPRPKNARAHNLSFAPAVWETMQTRAAERGFASVSAYLTHLVNEDKPSRVAHGRGVVKVKR